MATPVILPKLGMTMEEATILRWLKQEGDEVAKDEPLAEIMTEKVDMQIEAPAAGILRSIRARPGDVVPVAQIIAYIVAPGEDVPPPPPSVPAATVAPHAVPPAPHAPSSQGQPVAATPAARRVAREVGMDLSTIVGTGPAGSITEADVRVARSRPTPLALSDRRRIIARRMAQSAREIPHIYLTRAVDLSGAVVRGQASYTAVMVWAVARALRGHPFMRASLEGDTVVVYEALHIGVAVDAPEGLIVPVVRDADQKSFHTIHRELEVLVRRAREGALTLADVSDGVFTVSNLGMFGVDRFTALINPPQAALLAVGAVRPRPWVVDEALLVRPVAELTLALDHRIADGTAGARFLNDVCQRLETIQEGF